MRLSPSLTPQAIGQRASQPAFIFAAVAIAVAGASALLTMYYSPSVSFAVPLAIAALCAVLLQPYTVYLVSVIGPVFLPIQGKFLGVKVPDLLQFEAPVLVIASLVTGWRDKDWKGFRLHICDIFVVAFLVIGYAGILSQPYDRYDKMFVNHQVLPAALYFVARWQPITRKRFRQLVEWHLIAAACVLFIMAQSALTHSDIFYGAVGSMGASRGPYGDHASAAACTSFVGAFFVYAWCTGLGAPRRWLRHVWLFGCVAPLLVNAGIAQRAGFPAAIAAVVFCLFHPRLFGRVARIVVLLAAVGSLWYFSGQGANIRKRFGEENAGWRRELYREKAISYIRSPAWNPVIGCGYERLPRESDAYIPDRQVFDPERSDWRDAEDVALHAPVHCSPLTMLGEYGYGGMAALAGVGVCLAVSILGLFPLAQRIGRPADTAFIACLFAAAAAIMINAILHNTDKNEPMAIWVWNLVGIIISHPQALILSAEEVAANAVAAVKPRRGYTGHIAA